MADTQQATETTDQIDPESSTENAQMNQSVNQLFDFMREVRDEMKAQSREILHMKASARQINETTDDVYAGSLADLYGATPPPSPQRSVTDNNERPRFSNAIYSNKSVYSHSAFSNHPRRQTFQQRKTEKPTSTWFAEKMRNVVPRSTNASNITKTIVAPNPLTSQCRLKELTFSAFYNFINEIQLEMQKYPESEIMLGNYIKMNVIMQMRAYDFRYNITNGAMRVVGEIIVLGNDQLFHLLFVQTASQSKIEFLSNLINNCRFATPPAGYEVNPLKWQWAYEAYLMFFYRFTDLYSLLTHKDDPDNPYDSMAPNLKSKNGIIGLMEVVDEIPPLNIGLHMKAMLNPDAIKQCKSIFDYIDILQELSQHLFDQSRAAELDTQRFTMVKHKVSDIINLSNSSKKTYNNNYNKPSTPNNTNANNNDTSRNAYTNPHINRNNDNKRLYQMNEFNNSLPANDVSFNPYNDNDYDMYDPKVDNIPASTHVTSHVTHNDSYDNRDYDYTYNTNTLHALPSRPNSELVCFRTFNGGTCADSNCPYKHDRQALSAEWIKRQDLLTKSPFNPNKGGSSSHTSPRIQPQSSVRFPSGSGPPSSGPTTIAQRGKPLPGPSLRAVTEDSTGQETHPQITFGDWDMYDTYSDEQEVFSHNNLTPNTPSK
jgi:hypothetical protein